MPLEFVSFGEETWPIFDRESEKFACILSDNGIDKLVGKYLFFSVYLKETTPEWMAKIGEFIQTYPNSVLAYRTDGMIGVFTRDG